MTVSSIRPFSRPSALCWARNPARVRGATQRLRAIVSREIVATLPDQPSLQEIAKRLQRKWPRDKVVEAVRSLERDRIATVKLPSQMIDATIGLAALEVVSTR